MFGIKPRKKPNSTRFSFYKKISYVSITICLKTHDLLDFVFFVAANFLVSAAASAAGRSITFQHMNLLQKFWNFGNLRI